MTPSAAHTAPTKAPTSTSSTESAALTQPGAPVVTLTGAGVDAPGGRPILAGVDLQLRAGETLAVVGPNGAGKSTLLSLLAGDRKPSHGSVIGPQGPLADRPARELARFRAVMLAEHLLAFPFQVQDVVRMGRAPWRATPAESSDDRCVTQAVADADIAHLLQRRFPTLSGGEKARTSFARVLAQAPQLLLLDEPTAALDIHHTERLLTVARRHAAAGGTVVAVLHDLALASAYADRIVLLDRGRVAAVGAPEQVLTSGRLSEIYQHPVQVIPHPLGPGVLVLPDRDAAHIQGAAR